MKSAIHRALAQAGAPASDLSAFDLYSCFPAAVQLGAQSLGITAHHYRDAAGLLAAVEASIEAFEASLGPEPVQRHLEDLAGHRAQLGVVGVAVLATHQVDLSEAVEADRVARRRLAQRARCVGVVTSASHALEPGTLNCSGLPV